MSVLKVKTGENQWVSIPTGGVGVPSGGTQGQVLTKTSATDYATQWADPTGSGSGAYIGPEPPADSDIDLWVDTDDSATGGGVPPGGTTGQVLTKTGAADYAAGWSNLTGLPAGGTAGQILVKNSANNYDASFQNAWTETSLGNNCYLLKCGNAYSLRIATGGAVTDSGGVICTVPNEAIPTYAPWVCGAVTVGMTQANSSFQWVRIETNGNVTLRNLASGDSTSAGYYAFGGACGIWTV